MRWLAGRIIGGAVLTLAALGLAPVAAQARSSEPAYGDVPADAYYYEAVNALAADGVFEGTGCEEGFCPEQPLKRWRWRCG